MRIEEEPAALTLLNPQSFILNPRPGVRWLGIGASYNYFRLDVDVEQLDFGGSLDMTIQGPEAFVRLAF